MRLWGMGKIIIDFLVFSYMIIRMTIKIPSDLALEIGYTSNMIAKINRGVAKPSPKKCPLIIKAMRKRGLNITLGDLRPDLKDLIMESL